MRVLFEHGVEIPSDYQGVVYVPLDPAGAWRFLVAKEMKAIGFEIDMNLATLIRACPRGMQCCWSK